MAIFYENSAFFFCVMLNAMRCEVINEVYVSGKIMIDKFYNRQTDSQ